MNQYKLLTYANASMLISLLVFSTSVILAYGYEQYFGLMSLTLMHISHIILAGIFKLSYVVRLVALSQLGLEIR